MAYSRKPINLRPRKNSSCFVRLILIASIPMGRIDEDDDDDELGPPLPVPTALTTQAERLAVSRSKSKDRTNE